MVSISINSNNIDQFQQNIAMGGGVSTLSRLRNALVLRAYNIRPKDITLEEQFFKMLIVKNKVVHCINIEDIKQVLSVDASWIDDLFRALIGNIDSSDQLIQYDHFEFLETGKYLGDPSKVLQQ